MSKSESLRKHFYISLIAVVFIAIIGFTGLQKLTWAKNAMAVLVIFVAFIRPSETSGASLYERLTPNFKRKRLIVLLRDIAGIAMVVLCISKLDSESAKTLFDSITFKVMFLVLLILHLRVDFERGLEKLGNSD